jgi:hypothetical protein
VLIKLAKYFLTPPIQLPVEPDELLHPLADASGATSSPDSPADANPTPAPAPRHTDRTLAFDFGIARISLVIEAISYALVPFAPGGLAYTGITMVGAFGAGFGPAMQSVALGLYTARGGSETGKLFGALSVVQSLWCVLPSSPFLFYFFSIARATI